MGKGEQSNMSDEELVDRIRSGDKPAENRLLGLYRPKIFRFFSSKVPPDDAEDLTQKVLLALLVRLKGDEPLHGQLRSLTFGIARKVLLNFCSGRAQGRKFDPEVETLVDLDPSISRQVSRLRHINWLRAALEKLPLESLTLLELRYVQELTYAEIAQIYGLPAGTVTSRIRLAKEKLSGMRPDPEVTF